jgi:hypothetical protein
VAFDVPEGLGRNAHGSFSGPRYGDFRASI